MLSSRNFVVFGSVTFKSLIILKVNFREWHKPRVQSHSLHMNIIFSPVSFIEETASSPLVFLAPLNEY